MSPLPTIYPLKSKLLQVEPLEARAFAPFGTVVVAPIGPEVTTIPATTGQVQQVQGQVQVQPRPQFANQKTALKTSPVSPLINDYPIISSSHSSPSVSRGMQSPTHTTSTATSTSSEEGTGKGLMSIFSCFPRTNVYTDPNDGHRLRLKLDILERHPFTTQTFCPFNFSRSAEETVGGRTYFLVVVAPSLPSPSSGQKSVGEGENGILNPPDLSRLRAFIAPVTADERGVGDQVSGDNDDNGFQPQGMAVTYAPGTWHAPMVVLGERRVDFLVTQFANGRHADDCEEVLVGGPLSENVVEIGLHDLGLEHALLWRRPGGSAGERSSGARRGGRVNGQKRAKL